MTSDALDLSMKDRQWKYSVRSRFGIMSNLVLIFFFGMLEAYEKNKILLEWTTNNWYSTAKSTTKIDVQSLNFRRSNSIENDWSKSYSEMKWKELYCKNRFDRWILNNLQWIFWNTWRQFHHMHVLVWVCICKIHAQIYVGDFW